MAEVVNTLDAPADEEQAPGPAAPATGSLLDLARKAGQRLRQTVQIDVPLLHIDLGPGHTVYLRLGLPSKMAGSLLMERAITTDRDPGDVVMALTEGLRDVVVRKPDGTEEVVAGGVVEFAEALSGRELPEPRLAVLALFQVGTPPETNLVVLEQAYDHYRLQAMGAGSADDEGR